MTIKRTKSRETSTVKSTLKDSSIKKNKKTNTLRPIGESSRRGVA